MKFRIFFITYTVANIGLILYGIIALIQPGILLEPFFMHVYQFPSEATNAITYLAGLYRLIGYLNRIPGILGLVILHRYLSTRQTWNLKFVIAATSFSYLGPIVFDNTLGRIGFFEILEQVLFLTMLIVGFMMLKYEDTMVTQSSIQKFQ
jgi:multisubunit Na+/H+ antiporter MnhC subunit